MLAALDVIKKRKEKEETKKQRKRKKETKKEKKIGLENNLACLQLEVKVKRENTDSRFYQSGFSKETEPLAYILKKEIYFKELAHTTVRLASLKYAGKSGDQGRVGVAGPVSRTSKVFGVS